MYKEFRPTRATPTVRRYASCPTSLAGLSIRDGSSERHQAGQPVSSADELSPFESAGAIGEKTLTDKKLLVSVSEPSCEISAA
jgi:hypothetical protein